MHRTKDYSDNWDEFERGLKSRTTLDLTYYARNLISCASRIDGHDDTANALYDKLTRRASLVNKELATRGVGRAPDVPDEQRKRKVAELEAEFKRLTGDTQPSPSTGASHDDPPIPTRPVPLVPTSVRAPSPPRQELFAFNERVEEEEEDTQPLNYTPPSPYKKFKVSFEEEDK